MIDSHTQQRMVVYGEALTREPVKFWVKQQLIYTDVRPPVAIVSLSRTSNTAAVQQLLDSI